MNWWRQRDVALLRSLVEAGTPWLRIAQRLQRTRQACERKWQRINETPYGRSWKCPAEQRKRYIALRRKIGALEAKRAIEDERKRAA